MTVDAPFDPSALLGWLARRRPAEVVVSCGEHPDGTAIALGAWDPRAGATGEDVITGGQDGDPVLVRLPGCLADEPPALLVELLAAGVARVTVVVAGCPRAATTRASVSESAGLMAALGDPDRLAVARSGPASRPLLRVYRAGSVPVSRRALLGGHVAAVPSVPAHPQERLVAAVAAMAGSPDRARQVLGDRPAAALSLRAGGCCGHGACARACPESALDLQVTMLGTVAQAAGGPGPAGRPGPAGGPDAPGGPYPPGWSRDARGLPRQFVLEYLPSRCTGCGACIAVCPAGALTASGPMPWGQVLAGPVRLRAGLTRACGRCGGPVDGAGDRCALCRRRRADPFGSTLPPGFARRREADAT